MSATHTEAAGAEKSGASVIVLNALLRCTREDDKASAVFERIEEVPGLWVLELKPIEGNSWDQWLSEVFPTLAKNEALLRTLRADSADFTLHVTVGMVDGTGPVTIPPSLSQILASCGIAVEMYVWSIGGMGPRKKRGRNGPP